MKAVFISLLALCALFLADLIFQIYTNVHKRRVKAYREHREIKKDPYRECVFVDFTCPCCKTEQSVSVEYTKSQNNTKRVLQNNIRRCPMCGAPLKWGD